MTTASLHGRARGVPLQLLGVVGVALLGWAAADWLVNRPWTSGAEARIPVVVTAPLLVAIFTSLGFGGRDEELERSTAAPWRRYRAVHLALAVGAGAAVLVPIGLWEPAVYGALELVRNTFGFAGMAAAGAVVLGHRLAWVPPLGYASVVYVVAPKPISEVTAWWTWPLQPWDSVAARWTVAAVFVAGAAWYVAAGARPIRDADE